MDAGGGHFRIEPLTDGVYAAIAEPSGFGLCNAAIVDLGGTTLVFDAMLTPQAGAALGKAAERLTHRPVGVLVQSHYHGDHTRGTAAVGPLQVVSTRRVRELLLERARPHLAADLAEAATELERLRTASPPLRDDEIAVYDGWFRGILATPPDLHVRPPELTFEKELLLHGTKRSARVVSFGGGHSPSDVLVHLPEDGIVLLGDLLFVGFHPSMADGDPSELRRILAEVRGLGAERALPGHGPVGDRTAVPELERYVRHLFDTARRARQRGDAPESLARTPPPAPFHGWKFTRFYEENLRFVHAHLGRTAGPAVQRAARRPGRSRSSRSRGTR